MTRFRVYRCGGAGDRHVFGVEDDREDAERLGQKIAEDYFASDSRPIPLIFVEPFEES